MQLLQKQLHTKKSRLNKIIENMTTDATYNWTVQDDKKGGSEDQKRHSVN